jgi:hypothetical protein
MYKVLFDRSAFFVRSLEFLGLASATYTLWSRPSWGAIGSLLFLLLAQYLFVRICDALPWYGYSMGATKQIGIRVHFQKALVPTSYTLFLTTLTLLHEVKFLSLTILILANLMMMVLVGVNGILIFFHLKDDDPLPINYFSHAKGTKATPDEELLQPTP